jgi:hypothetical protein
MNNDKFPDRIGVSRSEYTAQEWYELFYDELPSEGDAVYVRIGQHETLWKCDGDNCETHGIVPAGCSYVPGWTRDDDGKWYCPTCGERLGLF